MYRLRQDLSNVFLHILRLILVHVLGPFFAIEEANSSTYHYSRNAIVLFLELKR